MLQGIYEGQTVITSLTTHSVVSISWGPVAPTVLSIGPFSEEPIREISPIGARIVELDKLLGNGLVKGLKVDLVDDHAPGAQEARE